jgi:hypothetical protein
MTDSFGRLDAALAGKYRIERELGEGGMATVYIAEDLKHHRQVAVKVLRQDLAASLGAERFLREIEIAAKLHHPHILPLYDSGGAGDVLFYVMPLVEGQSLRERLAKGGALPIDEAVRIIREVADALAYSHQHGVVHRDIKPENMFERALATSSAYGGNIYEPGWYTQALLMLGESYDARGDRSKAAEYYRRYVDVFKDPDPPIAAQVAAVRQKLARVTGEPGAKDRR